MTPPNKYGQGLSTPNHHWAGLLSSGSETSTSAYDLTSGGNDLSYGAIIVSPARVASGVRGTIDIRETFGPTANGVEIIFFSTATDIATDTFDFELYAYREPQAGSSAKDGPPSPVYYTTGSNSAILGTMISIVNPITGADTPAGLFCDTITGTDVWPTGVVVTDSGNNRRCSLTFDLMGHRYLHINTYNCDGSGTEAGTIGAAVSAY